MTRVYTLLKIKLIYSNNKETKYMILEMLLTLLINSVSLMLASKIFEGFYIASFGYAIITSLVISFLGRLVKPTLELLLLPMTIITTGLSYPLINVIILKLASLVMGSAFVVKGWILPFFISIFLSIITIVLDQIITKKIIGE